MGACSKLIGFPPAVARARLLTEYFFLRSAIPAANPNELRRHFMNRITRHRRFVAFPLYSLETSTFDEYLEEKKRSGYVQGDKLICLTPLGWERLALLEPKATRLTCRSR